MAYRRNQSKIRCRAKACPFVIKTVETRFEHQEDRENSSLTRLVTRRSRRRRCVTCVYSRSPFHALMFPESTQHQKTSRPPGSMVYVHCAVPPTPFPFPPPPKTYAILLGPTPPTYRLPSDLSPSIDPHSEEDAALYRGIPFITRTFSHACPTRAPGDANRMHSVLNTFFQDPFSGQEKKRRLRERITGLFLCIVFALSLELTSL